MVLDIFEGFVTGFGALLIAVVIINSIYDVIHDHVKRHATNKKASSQAA